MLHLVLESTVRLSLSLNNSRNGFDNSATFGEIFQMPAHQGIGCCTLDMTPWTSISFSACLTLSRRGNGIFLAIPSENGLASGFIRIS